MRIKIRLSNGIAINKNLTIEQLHKIEQSKQFKKADKKASKLAGCNYDFQNECTYCVGVVASRCQERVNNRLDILTIYINFLNNFKGV